MFNFLAFYVLFGVFMLRAYILDWESIFSSSIFDTERHVFSFFIFMMISLVILFVVMLEVTNAAARLDTEYKGIYVTPVEFRAGIGRDKVGAARFSENVKCEIDAD